MAAHPSGDGLGAAGLRRLERLVQRVTCRHRVLGGDQRGPEIGEDVQVLEAGPGRGGDRPGLAEKGDGLGGARTW